MYCSNCGKKLSSEDYFCSNCGTPVLRQGLFDEDEMQGNEGLEETRLFTSEELGQYLNDANDASSDFRSNDYAERIEEDFQDEDSVNFQPLTPPEFHFSSLNIEDDAWDHEKVDESYERSIPLAPKGKILTRLKSKIFSARSNNIEYDSDQYDEIDNIVEESYYDSQLDENIAGENEKLTKFSFLKFAIPVILLGLIIGFVIGLVIIQPWTDEAESEETTTTVSTIIVCE